jgi:uncharacterized protein YjiS (DUF1127 family)
MTYLRSVYSDLGNRVLQPPPRYGALQLVSPPLANRAGSPMLGALRLLGRGARTALRWARQRREARRAQRELLDLDDRLLRDVGLTRADVRSGNITKGRL